MHDRSTTHVPASSQGLLQGVREMLTSLCEVLPCEVFTSPCDVLSCCV